MTTVNNNINPTAAVATATAITRKRPKRQRTPTTIYTDDKPNTFATKRKSNGEIIYGPEASLTPVINKKSFWAADVEEEEDNDDDNDDDVEESVLMPPPPAPVVKRGPGRPPRQKSLEPKAVPVTITQITTPTNNGLYPKTMSTRGKNASSVTSNHSSTTPTTTIDKPSSSIITGVNIISAPVKRKRGRPPKIRPNVIYDIPSSSSRSVIKQERIRVVSKASNTTPGKDRRHAKQQSKTSTTDTPSKSASRKKSSSLSRIHPKFATTTTWTSPQHDLEGTFLNHPITLAPILPPILKRNNQVVNEESTTAEPSSSATTSSPNDLKVSANDPQMQTWRTKFPAVFNQERVPKLCTKTVTPFASSSASVSSSLSSSKIQQLQTPQPPSWTPLHTPPVYFEDDYDRDTGQLDLDTTIPVTRKITSLTVRKPHHDYLALGDSAGFVLVYALGKDNVNRPVARLESVACQQRARPEQDRLRTELQRKRAKVASRITAINKIKQKKGLSLVSSNAATMGRQQASSILMDTSDTTIHALGMIGDRVVLGTIVELECMDIPSGTSLWVCPLSSNRYVTSLDMHLLSFDVLVSCSKITTTDTAVPVSSLMLLQHSENNVEICDANSPMLVRSPFCTAIWDVGCTNRLLFTALSASGTELDLVLVSGGSIDTWKVVCKTKIPIKAVSSKNSDTCSTKLTQSPGGEYTLVASSRGIRLFHTESLHLIHVYGDQLSLHGQSVIWKDCCLAGSFFMESNACHKGGSSLWMEVDDWLAQCNGCDKEEYKSKTDLAPYIVGVPHAKGPKELCETIHVWKVEHATVVPAMSIPLPHKGEGALGVVGGGSNNSGNLGGTDRIIMVTNDGQGHLLLPKMESNFAGIMYPPGYQVITDNIDYIEQEDALDDVVPYDDLSHGQSDNELEEIQVEEDVMDEELKEAMRQSLLEHQRHEEAREAMGHDRDVDVVVNAPQENINYLPCRPEPYLRQCIHTTTDDEDEEEDVEASQTENPVDFSKKNSEVSLNSEIKVGMEHQYITNGAAFVANILEAIPTMEKPQPVEDEDCLSFTTTKVVVAVNPVSVIPARPGRGRKSRAGNLDAMLKSSINPYLQSLMIGRQGVPTDGSGSRLKAMAFVPNDTGQVDCISEPNNGAATNGEGNGHLSPDQKSATADEAAVALGLLGLSPSPTHNESKPTDVLSEAIAAEHGETKGRVTAYLNASSLSALPGRIGPPVGSFTASSDRDSVTGTEDSTGESHSKPKPQGSNQSCSACRGRHIIHICGKRALPIDYDEVAKVDRERKEKEEGEKKRIRAEKRRLADQRRRETKKQKQRELEEQRMREEEEIIKEKERQRRLQEDFASQDLNRQRRDQIVSSYAHFAEGTLEITSVNYNDSKVTSVVERIPQTPAPASFDNVTKPEPSTVVKSFSRPRVGSIFEQASRMMNDGPRKCPVSAGEAAALYKKNRVTPGNTFSYATVVATKTQTYATPAPLTPPLDPAAPPPIETHSASSRAEHLEALDGLAALAELARATPVPTSKAFPPSITPASHTSGLSSQSDAVKASTESTEGSVDVGSFSYAASHGFGASITSTPGNLVVAKRAIPTYATIRGQVNGSSEHTRTNGGVQHTFESYVWPPRREQQD